MQDPISDMLTRIRNGQTAGHKTVSLASSKFKEAIASVLKEEGYISDYTVQLASTGFKEIMISLKYYHGHPVIDRIRRISRPGLRIYKSYKDLKPVRGFGIVILSTSRGIMSHRKAMECRVGGEMLCDVA